MNNTNRSMNRGGMSRWGRFLVMSAALLMLLPAHAHVDDPKVRDRQDPYPGPGYRNGMAKGPEFQSDGVTLLSWITLPEFGAHITSGNDCWGYVSPSGREYALMGLSHGVAFVDITDPGNPVILDLIQGPTSIWRDIKTYQQFAYAVSEGGDGIQVFDLSQIDGGVVSLVNTVTGVGTDDTHNVTINEESGYLYRCGGDDFGLRIYDLVDPVNPVHVATWLDKYVHDAQVVTYTDGPYAGREIAFSCAGFNGGSVNTGLSIVDVTDKDNLQPLVHYEYPGPAYSHQGWLSSDRQFFMLNDELDESFFGISSTTHVIDVSDLMNPIQVATFSNNNPAIDHNLYIRGNTMFAANYRSGLRIFNIADPLNAFETGFFDTFPLDDRSNFNGLWSSYPYFPSQTIIGSDLERGLFVWSLNQLMGDVNGDGVINETDLNMMIQQWNLCSGDCSGDLNQSGTVDVRDLSLFMSVWQ